MPTYYAEAGGGRVLRATTNATQIGTAVVPTLETWDAVPAGESGDVLFRSVDVTLRATNGYTIVVTPAIDGVAQAAQAFSRVGSGTFTEQVPIAERGSRVSASVQITARGGSVSLEQVTWTGVVLRATP